MAHMAYFLLLEQYVHQISDDSCLLPIPAFSINANVVMFCDVPLFFSFSTMFLYLWMCFLCVISLLAVVFCTSGPLLLSCLSLSFPKCRQV